MLYENIKSNSHKMIHVLISKQKLYNHKYELDIKAITFLKLQLINNYRNTSSISTNYALYFYTIYLMQ